MSTTNRPGTPDDAEPRGPHLPGELGQGPLGRLTGHVYWFLVVTVLLALACLPTVVLLLLLDRSWGNVAFAALSAAPVGPALSAALYATRDRARSDDLAPAASFWRGYRQNWADVLRVWLPALVLLAIIAYVLANSGAAGISGAHVIVLAVIAVVVLTWALHAVAIASVFSFRTRDVARLASYYLVTLPLVSLGVLSLVLVAAAVVVAGTEVALALLGAVWVWFWARNDERMIEDVRARFTTEGAGRTDTRGPDDAASA